MKSGQLFFVGVGWGGEVVLCEGKKGALPELPCLLLLFGFDQIYYCSS